MWVDWVVIIGNGKLLKVIMEFLFWMFLKFQWNALNGYFCLLVLLVVLVVKKILID